MILTKLWKGIKSLADDFVLLLVTTVGVLTTSYLDTIRIALRDHPPVSELQWPQWYIVALAGFVALVVVIVDASRGTPEDRKARLGPRIGKSLLLGIGALALLEKIIGGA